MATTVIQTPKQGRDPATLAPRAIRIGLDPILAAAAIALGVASIVTLGGSATPRWSARAAIWRSG